MHQSKHNKIVDWIIYPAVIIAGISLHYCLLGFAWNIQTATYVPIVLAATLITVLESIHLHKREWKANSKELLSDISFMMLVQVLLPRFLAFFISITLVRFIESQQFEISVWWPQLWSNAAQAILMLLLADFVRYWLHRASHEWVPPLWQLHAVHHSPKKLYWINVGRFHPIEKSLQYIFDALPFILLGVSEQVLALYFVFYSINGFFQHCNIKLKLGLLNYIVSGPELHRWHHSKIISESNKNYGNNFIIWDLLFGSYFLPKNRQVSELGLLNDEYPQDFISQMKTPFIKGLDKA